MQTPRLGDENIGKEKHGNTPPVVEKVLDRNEVPAIQLTPSKHIKSSGNKFNDTVVNIKGLGLSLAKKKDSLEPTKENVEI